MDKFPLVSETWLKENRGSASVGDVILGDNIPVASSLVALILAMAFLQRVLEQMMSSSSSASLLCSPQFTSAWPQFLIYAFFFCSIAIYTVIK